MVKIVFCLHRQDHLTHEEFDRYWREVHAPLVKRHADVLGIRRYVQLCQNESGIGAALRAGRGAPEPYDGVAELWFDSAEVLGAAPSAEARAAGRELLEDERRFIDLDRSPIWLFDERAVI